MKIVIIKQTDARLEDEQANAVRQWLFQFFKGATVADEKGWRRFTRAMNEGAAGEYFQPALIIDCKQENHALVLRNVVRLEIILIGQSG